MKKTEFAGQPKQKCNKNKDPEHPSVLTGVVKEIRRKTSSNYDRTFWVYIPTESEVALASSAWAVVRNTAIHKRKNPRAFTDSICYVK